MGSPPNEWEVNHIAVANLMDSSEAAPQVPHRDRDGGLLPARLPLPLLLNNSVWSKTLLDLRPRSGAWSTARALKLADPINEGLTQGLRRLLASAVPVKAGDLSLQRKRRTKLSDAATSPGPARCLRRF